LGDNRQVILVGTEMFRLPRVWEGLGVQLGVAEHLQELGVVEGAVDGGVDVFRGCRWGLVGPMGVHERAHRVRGEGPLVEKGGWAVLLQGGVVGGGRGGRGVRGGG